MIAHHTKVIAELKAHDFRSWQFFDIASSYFRRRLRFLRTCCLFLFFLVTFGVLISFISQAPLWNRILILIGSSYGVYLCWNPYRIGLYGIRIIDGARRLGGHHQLDCLEFMATNLGTCRALSPFRGDPAFRGDPVAVYILQLLSMRDQQPNKSRGCVKTPGRIDV